MGRYLEKLRQLSRDKSDKSDQSLPAGDFGRLNRFRRTSRLQSVLDELQRRIPDHIGVADWKWAIADGRVFLAVWGEQAETLGWTVRDLFGLGPVPANPPPGFRRLGRYDLTGMLWLLKGRAVVGITADAIHIRSRPARCSPFTSMGDQRSARSAIASTTLHEPDRQDGC